MTSLVTTVLPPYPQVIRSKTYCAYVVPWIILNAIYNVITHVTYINTVTSQ
jgi:hypothetical protein